MICLFRFSNYVFFVTQVLILEQVEIFLLLRCMRHFLVFIIFCVFLVFSGDLRPAS